MAADPGLQRQSRRQVLMLPVDTRILADAEAVAEEACRLIGVAAKLAIRERGVFR